MEAILTIHGETAEILIMAETGVEVFASELAVSGIGDLFEHAEDLLTADGLSTGGSWRRDSSGSDERYAIQIR